MHGSHDGFLVALSVTVAAVASYTALDLAGRIRATTESLRVAWLIAAAIAMGGGIWSMHFIAMLAFSMPMPVSYDVTLTVASLLLAISVTGASFAAVARSSGGHLPIAFGGLLMGVGIAGMHYLGMAAMRMDADLSYDAVLVVVSVFIAIGASSVALFLAFRNTLPIHRLLAATAMGLAVSGMHYTAMVGSIFAPKSPVDEAYGISGIGQTQLALAVASATLLILLIALVAAMFDRRFGELAEREAAALRASEEQFRQLYNQAPVPLHVLDEGGNVLRVSDAWLELMQFAREEVIGLPLSEFLTEPAKLSWRATHFGDGQEGLTGEYQFRTRGGAVLDISVTERLMKDAEGRVLRLGGLTDLTSRKRAETELRQAQKLESIGQLTGGLAHDFNNLLNVVLGNVELLIKRTAHDATAKRLADGIEQAARRGAALTQRMLAFARKQDLKPEAIDLPDLVRGMSELLSRTLGPRIEVDVAFPLSLPKVFADRNQLELALLNLAVNARDAMPAGGNLTIAATLDLAGESNREYIRLAISDNGEGMDPETLSRAMDPFFTTKGVGKGTGLGLSMVQGLALQLEGQFLLESTKGEGTTAILRLPVFQREPQSASHALTVSAPVEELQLQGLVALVVDDDALVLMGTAAMLEDLCFTVIEATSGPHAMDLLRAGTRVDVVLTDYAMPKMNGIELAREVRRLQPTMPIILASGYAELAEADLSGVIRLGKPFQQSALKGAIADAIKAKLSSEFPQGGGFGGSNSSH